MADPTNVAPAGPVRWEYSAAEVWADGAVHAATVSLAGAGAVALVVRSSADRTAAAVYLATLLLSATVSAAYNLWPVSRLKWLLRRLDHSAIYLLIAGTYTPFMARLGTWWLLAFVWGATVPGVALKLFRPGRYDRLAVGLYLALGWSGLVILDRMVADLPEAALWLIGLGGLTYTGGVVFHLWERLRFQNAIWHGFVLVASTCYFGAVWSTLGA